MNFTGLGMRGVYVYYLHLRLSPTVVKKNAPLRRRLTSPLAPHWHQRAPQRHQTTKVALIQSKGSKLQYAYLRSLHQNFYYRIFRNVLQTVGESLGWTWELMLVSRCLCPCPRSPQAQRPCTVPAAKLDQACLWKDVSSTFFPSAQVNAACNRDF